MPPRKKSSVRNAADEMVAAMRELGRIEAVDAVRVAALLSLADAVDANPENASLWAQFRAAEAALREIGTDGDDSFEQSVAALQAAIRDAAPT